MNSRPRSLAILFAILVAALGMDGTPRRTQDLPSEARLVAFTVEPQAPEFAEVFDLQVTVRIAPGIVAFLPDTLVPSGASVSAGSGGWTETAGPGDSVDVRATYPVMGFLNGRVELPSLELWTRPAADGEASGPRLASDLGETGPTSGAALRRIQISIGATEITPLREMAEAGDGLFPRPPADVLGGQWSLWFLSAVGLMTIVLAVLAWLLISHWRLTRDEASEGLGHRLSPRSEALRELERIRGLGLHTQGRFAEFYDATTGALRGFSEQYESAWGIALTSNELLVRLRDRWGRGSVDDLGSAVSIAEWAKFGRYRPEVEAAEGHWMTIRDWIEGMPED